MTVSSVDSYRASYVITTATRDRSQAIHGRPGRCAIAAKYNQKAQEWRATLVAFRRYGPPRPHTLETVNARTADSETGSR